MTIKDFITRAIEGGWKPDFKYGQTFQLVSEEDMKIADGAIGELLPSAILLDPLAWQAVGKVEGWEGTWFKEVWTEKKDELHAPNLSRFGTVGRNLPAWRYYMESMIDALAEGKTLEQFIETL